MIVVPFYWADSIDTGIDVLTCTTQEEAITKLIGVMRGRSDEKSQDRLLDTALNHVKQSELNEALQCLDTWCEEYNKSGKFFIYTIKDTEESNE